MPMTRLPATHRDDQASERSSRVRQRRLVVGLVVVFALLTTAQGFAVDGDHPLADGEGRGRLISNTEAVAPVAPVDDTPLAPPSLPEAEPVDVDPPASRVQTEAQPSPRPSPRPEVATLDTSPVTAQQPRIMLQQADTMVDDPVSQALEVEGVTFATSIEIGQLPIVSEKEGATPVRVAAVDPNGFRVLTPQVTADAVEVWQRIAEGDAAFTHDVGTRLELELGSRVPTARLSGASGQAPTGFSSADDPTIRVGAYASNGVPPVADAIVSRTTARELGISGARTVLVSVAEGIDPEQLAEALASVTGMEAELIAEPETRRAFLGGAAARDAFEPFSYVSIGDGMIQIDRDWVSRNIVSASVPIFRGNVICHRLIIPQLRGALNEIVQRDLAHLIDPSQYGGCWVPRHILFNPNRALSMHAWGIAIDFNVRGNEYGNRNPEMDPRIVEIFKRWGFAWGGDWSTPDGMHFELNQLLQTSDG
jgi:hypothetical protein